MRAFIMTAEERIFSAKSPGTDRVLNDVVVGFEPAVVKVKEHAFPAGEDIADRVGEFRPWYCPESFACMDLR